MATVLPLNLNFAAFIHQIEHQLREENDVLRVVNFTFTVYSVSYLCVNVANLLNHLTQSFEDNIRYKNFYVAGSFSGGSDIYSFHAVGISNSAIASNLQLQNGHRYYAIVKGIFV